MRIVKRWWHGWVVFFVLLKGQLKKKHGKGRRPLLPAIYFASGGQWITDHQHRRFFGRKTPIHGRIAQWLHNHLPNTNDK
jgi:hypothetical protein